MSNIESIVFHGIAGAFAATPHSRKMAGLIIACLPRIVGAEIVARHCASPEFASATLDAKNPKVDFVLLNKGLLHASRVIEYAESALVADYESNKDSEAYHTGLAALGSPLIASHLKSILDRAPKWPSTRAWRWFSRLIPAGGNWKGLQRFVQKELLWPLAIPMARIFRFLRFHPSIG